MKDSKANREDIFLNRDLLVDVSDFIGELHCVQFTVGMGMVIEVGAVAVCFYLFLILYVKQV